MMNISDLIKKEKFDIKDYTIILSTKGHVHLGQLKNITDVHYNAAMASANELSFTVHWNEKAIISEYYDLIIKEEIDESVVKSLIQAEKDIWDQIEDLKLIYVKELNEYFEIRVRYTDAEDTVKAITATSACEAELGQLNIYTTEINTEQDILRPEYVPTKFYNEVNHDASLLHRILSDKAPHYTIAHVDDSLKNLQRTFSIDGTSIYDFLTGECAEQFNCLFTFNSVERSISVYDLYTVCQNNKCNYRGDYHGVCPKCGGTNLKYYGEDTLIYVDKENLTDEVVLEADVDSIKNCFKLEAGDDIMTARIRDLNQNGTDYIYYISEEQQKDMSQGLKDKIKSYDALYAQYEDEYRSILEEEYQAIDQILYYQSKMMPESDINNAEINASTEAAKLTSANLSPLGLSTVDEYTSEATVEGSVLSYARVYVKTGYVKLELNQSKYTYDGSNRGTWKGNFKVTNYSDPEDIAYSNEITIRVDENYQEWLEQKVLKQIASDADDEDSIFNVLAIKNLSDFKNALKKYGLNRLTSFKDALQSAIDVLAQADQAKEGADLYTVLYLPYYEKFSACVDEIDVRAATIKGWEAIEQDVISRKTKIQKKLNFEKYLGSYYSEFCTYRREDKYSNSNFISDGLNDDEMFKNAEEFLETAKKELEKSATRQHSISTTLYNLLLIPEFEPLLENFELGNWIRVGIDDSIYRLRLIGCRINFSSLNNIEVEFSDIIKTKDASSDVAGILKSAKSMSSSYSYVSNQATKGKDAQSTIKNWVAEGLNTAKVQLKNNDTEDVVIDKHGILCRSVDTNTDKYSPKQLRITGNILAFTKDNWKNVSCALGEHNYTYYDDNIGGLNTNTGYGLSSDFMQSGWIYGSHIIAGDILSENYSSKTGKGSYWNLRDGSFSLADSKIVYDNDTSTLTFNNVTIDWETTNEPELQIAKVEGLQDYLDRIDGDLDGRAETWYQATDPSANWTTAAVKKKHVGDLWHYTGSTGTVNGTQRTKNSEWVWVQDGSTYKWSAIAISDDVFDTLDKKAQIFTITPTPPYYVGDLWVQGSTGDIKHCKTSRTSGNYVADDWEISSKYTDDSELNSFINGTYAVNLSSINSQLDKKAETWYQATDPSSNWSTTEMQALHVGDLWHYTGSTGDVNGTHRVKNSEWIWTKSGSTYKWSAMEVSDDVFDAIDGKAQIFTSTPQPPYSVGDLWVQGSTGDIKHCTTSRASGNYVASDWKVSSKYTDNTVANSAKDIATNAQTIGNQLVNGLGFSETEVTGEYVISPVIAGGTLLIGDTSGTYAQITTSGKLKCSGADIAGTVKINGGSLLIGDKNNTYAEITNDGILNCSGANVTGTITGSTITGCSITSGGGDGSNTITLNGGVMTIGSSSTYGLTLANAGMTFSWGDTYAQLRTLDFSNFFVALRNDKGMYIYDQDRDVAEKKALLYNTDGGGYFLLNRDFYSGTYCQLWKTDVMGALTATTLTVKGTKSRMAKTENYENRLLYCYEMPSPMFGDIGEGQIDETGKCYIFLDDIFAETIDSQCSYQVFLQPYGSGECYVIERTSSYFVVEGTKGLSFGWELKAIQKDFDTMRLEEYQDEREEDITDVMYRTTNYLDNFLYDLESEEF